MKEDLDELNETASTLQMEYNEEKCRSYIFPHFRKIELLLNGDRLDSIDVKRTLCTQGTEG